MVLPKSPINMENPQSIWGVLILTGAKRREWMGCWGLLGLLLIVSQWIIPSNSLRLAQVRIGTSSINGGLSPKRHVFL